MKPSGFTLVELLVGLLLAGLAVSIAAGIYLTTTDTLGRLASEAELWDRRARARSWLTQTLTGARVSPNSGAVFRGTPDSISFRSSVWVSEGWLEDRAVEIVADGRSVDLRIDGQDVVRLLDSLHATAIEYRGALGAGEPWLRRWDSFTSPPLAVRLRFTSARSQRADSMLVFIGARR